MSLSHSMADAHAGHRTAREIGAWRGTLAIFVVVRLATPLAALAASGSKLPGMPRYGYVSLPGDATGYYAGAREFLASWGRLPQPLLGLLAAVFVMGSGWTVTEWRRRPERRWWLLVAWLAMSAATVCAGIAWMNPNGAAVIGWPLVWSLPMLPARLFSVLDPNVAFGIGLALSLAANAVTLVSIAFLGLYATGNRSVGLAAAGIFSVWPLLTGVIAGPRAWENGTWEVDVGLHLYSEPLSTCLVTVALVVLVRREASSLRLSAAGAALSLATAVKLSNGLLLAAAVLLFAARHRVRPTVPLLLGGLTFLSVVAAYWRLGYVKLFPDSESWPQHPFELSYLVPSWTDSLLFRPEMLLLLGVPAVVGAVALRRRRFAVAVIVAWVMTDAVFYSFFANTSQHPRFLFASLPPLFVLWAAGVGAVLRRVRRLWPGTARAARESL